MNWQTYIKAGVPLKQRIFLYGKLYLSWIVQILSALVEKLSPNDGQRAV